MQTGEKLYEELLLEDETGLILENDKFFLRLPLKIGDKDAFHYKQWDSTYPNARNSDQTIQNIL